MVIVYLETGFPNGKSVPCFHALTLYQPLCLNEQLHTEKIDRKSCETAWPVIQISEEYYMLDAKLLKQSIDNNDGICDKIEVDINGDKVTYYFEISKIFEGRKNFEKK